MVPRRQMGRNKFLVSVERKGHVDLAIGAHQRRILFHVRIAASCFQIMDNLMEFTFVS